MSGTFTEWVCPSCRCMWVYRNSTEGLAALDGVKSEHRCVKAVAS